MNKNIQEKIIDITGIELTPGNDECDYFLLCFPEFDVKIKKEKYCCK